MKNLKSRLLLVFTTLLVVLLTSTMSAQNYAPKSHNSGKAFDVSQSVKTNEVFNFEGKTYNIFKVEATGTEFIKAVSSSGKEYPVWIFELTGDTFEGKDVYVTKKGSYCIYKTNKNGFPYPFWLNKTN